MNQSAIDTVVAVAVTSNIRLASLPGNLLLTAEETGLPKDSVVNMSQLITVDKTFLSEYIADLSDDQMARIDDGLRLVLDL